MIKNIKIYSLVFIVLCVAMLFVSSVIAKEKKIPVEISNFTEIQELYSYSPDYNQIFVMKDGKICFTTNGRLYIYDLTNHSVIDNVLLADDSNQDKFTSWIKLLNNGNILILQNDVKSYNNKNSKTIIKVYSPHDKKIIFSKKVPRMPDRNYAFSELSENELIFFGGAYEDFKKTFIVNIKNNNIKQCSNLNVERLSANVIQLNDGRFFIIGEITKKYYPDNYAEIYDVVKNTSTKIPLGFNVHSGVNNTRLSKLSDGRILILCDRAYNTPQNSGKKEGFLLPDDRWIDVYPETYLTIFNPKDNSFEEIDINKNRTTKRTEYDVLALDDNRILITGGCNTSGKKSEPATNILIYDIKTNTLSTASQNFKYTHKGVNMSYLLNNGSILVSGWNLHLPLLDNKVERIEFK